MNTNSNIGRMMSGKTDGNQVDQVLVSKKWKKIIHDVRSYRGANYNGNNKDEKNRFSVEVSNIIRKKEEDNIDIE